MRNAKKASFLAPVKSNKVQIIQGTVYFAQTLAETAAGKKVFDLAFRTFVAHSAGHVCGKGEACSANDVVVTSFKGVSVSFRLRVVDGQIATQAIANIKARMEDGTVFAASLAAAGVTDITTLKKLVLGEKSSFKVRDEPKVKTEDQEEHISSLRILRCVKLVGAIGGAMLMLLLAFIFARYFCKTRHVELEEVSAAPVAVVVTVQDTSKYSVVKGEGEDLSKNQL